MVAIADFRRHVFRELGLANITGLGIQHSHIIHRRQLNALPDDVHIHYIPASHLLDFEVNLGPGLSFHPVGGLADFQGARVHSVNLHYLISALQPVLCCRRTFIWLIDNHISSIFLVDYGTDSTIGIGKHHLKILVLLLRDINSVRVQLCKHRIYSCTHYPVHIEAVHIGKAQLAHY